jgi:hypothetical protein
MAFPTSAERVYLVAGPRELADTQRAQNREFGHPSNEAEARIEDRSPR